MSPRPDLPPARVAERSELMRQLEAAPPAGERPPAAAGRRAQVRQAYELLRTPPNWPGPGSVGVNNGPLT